MTKPFEEWTVFPHRPIEKLTSNLWRVHGDLPDGNGTRVMTIAKNAAGGLVIHNAIALEEEQMKEIEAFGTVDAIVVPGGFHRLDAKVFKKRYPKARVVSPHGAKKKVADVVAVDVGFDDVSTDDVKLVHLAGMKEKEGVLQIKSEEGTTLVFNDVINNLPKMGGVFGFMLSPTGRPSVPRIARWMLVSDKAAFQKNVEELASLSDLKRVIVSHGAMMTDKPGDGLRTALTAF